MADDQLLCTLCGRWERLDRFAYRGENPRWCAHCNFDRDEFRRLQEQDRVHGLPVRKSWKPAMGGDPQ